ncbi:RHS repeat-associated core domain-containing protein [Epilithonimonas zeae]|uniref:RHS repeat-associated core domain-containing protein n=1 Tax=Epilithonimonas zeae TaxID=1416779 RepID=UPI00200DD2C8|nr:RHS repeat-associated core domain-containing protein [Epilithonimonas zeae]
MGNNLQNIDYSYNIRGWLTKVNDPASLNGKLFAYELKYNNPANTSLATARHNGNITEVDWNSSADNTRRRYGYIYDGNNRLTKASYQEPGHTVPYLKYYDEEVSYDLNGNIATLKRNGKPMKGTTPSAVDNLTYFYDGNKLTSITDASANKSGYPGGGLTNTYDPNGNMLTMPDKKITQEMIYNFLNLPESIEQNTTQTQYYYRADGVKLKKVFTLSSQTIKTEYLDGFVYATPYSGALKTAVEADTEIAKDASSAGQREAFTLAEQQLSSDPVDQAVIQPYFFPTSEGFYDYENKRYIYQYKDHLGNVRVSYAKNTATGAAEYLNGNNYYPFGLNFINSGDAAAVYNPSANYANYKYNQKELQETGFYDYGWRQYMPDLGRWFGMDQLSETYSSTSPYAYVMNNPISFFDPDGRYTQSSGNNWLQDMWDNTTSYSSWSNTGNGSFKGGEIGMPHDQFTSFYNFLSGGGTGSYTYWTNAAGNSTGSHIQGLDGHKVNITDNGWMSDMIDKAAGFMDSIWNSNFARSLVPDRMGITLGTSAGGGLEFGMSGGIEFILRGKDAGIYVDPFNTASLGGVIGGGGEYNLNYFTSRFSGNVSDISLNSVVGMEWYMGGTAAVVGGVNGGYSMSFDPNPNNGAVLGRWHTTTSGLSIGAKGSVGVGFTISNTRIGVGFDGKSRIADYSGLLTGKKGY